MIRINSPFGKTVSVTCTFALVFCMTPSMAWAKTVNDAKGWIQSKMPPKLEALTPSKILSAATRKASQGKTGENPYAAGQSKWDVMYKGVNLMSGNFTVSGTDLTFEGGYGIPVNVTRSYSANEGDEGPLGKGWTISVDVRSTAGGIMKSAGSPVRSVPNNFKERPSAQIDPNAEYANGAAGNTSSTSPISAVLATDSGGQEETIQRDADGILSTPPWDKNKIDSTYQTIVAADGTNFQVMTSNVVNTPEGTVYIYQKQGDYGTAGVKPFNDSTATGEPSNVLKVMTATDRQGNVTTYTYGTGYVSFVKMNGTTSEHPLTKIQMPNGHTINFTWTGNRITSANDQSYAGQTGYRTVNYGYTNGLLTSVTTPGGKTTTYGYGNASETHADGPNGATDIITSITDCRGLQTTIAYAMEYLPRFGWSTTVRRQVAPNGVKTDFYVKSFDDLYVAPIADVFDYVGADYDFSTHLPVPGLIHGFSVKMVYYNGIMSIMACPATAYQQQDANINRNLWQKDYDAVSQNLNVETNSVYYTNDRPDRFDNPYTATVGAKTLTSYTTSTTTYNFMGSPLYKVGAEYHQVPGGSMVQDRTTSLAYSYWGAEKYYQQKAIKQNPDSSSAYWRYSYTDYYDNQAAQGKKGQTYKVYDQARSTFYEDTSIPIPVSVPPCPTANYWKYRLKPTSDTYSAKFDYDTKGRAIDVWKIQKTTPTFAYVQTHTSYGADSDGSWGQANQVVEDYGGINRTTNTLAYDSFGRAINVQDASGKQFHTTYDADGVIQSIEKIVSGISYPVVTYTYGTSGLTNGAVLSVTDNLSGVSQAMSYTSTGGGKGMPASVNETNGSDSYSTAYTYTSAGDVDVKTYTTQSGLGLGNTVKWKYSDYTDIGVDKGSHIFTTITNLDASTGNATSEEFEYAYDSMGRPAQATFAMTPQAWSPSGGASFYDSGHKAATRARTYYSYDGGGRMLGIYNWWDTLQTNNSWVNAPIRSNECAYELSGLNRGLKTQNKFYNVVSNAWNLQRTEGYGYDPSLDYLTSANYGDGLANATPSWTYDAAGNRASDSTNTGTWTYDNLNRMTASPGTTYTNDILGNRLSKLNTATSATTTYLWDSSNRLSAVNSGDSNPPSYVYRADGLRVSKLLASGVTQYRYDGQIGTEDVERNSVGTITSISRAVIDVRGVAAVSRTTNSGTIVTYPLYDAHGNGVALLSKAGSTWSITDERTYDAWGGIRTGGTSVNKGRYCAELGHKQDDESGLIYMRARYYESASGRFVSQDHWLKGWNFYVYCSNCPISRQDFSGCADGDGGFFDFPGAIAGFIVGYVAALIANGEFSAGDLRSGVLTALITCCSPANKFVIEGVKGWIYLIQQICGPSIKAFSSVEVQAAEDTEAGPAVVAEAMEAGAIGEELVEIAVEEL